MEQNALTAIVPIKSSADTDKLKKILTELNEELGENLHFHFQKTLRTHFARMVVLPPPIQGMGSRLLFTSNYDGDFASYMQELVTQVGDQMEEIWQHCEGYSPGIAKDAPRFTEFINRHSHKAQVFYVGLPGVTVENIVNNTHTREALDRIFDNQEVAQGLEKLYSVLLPNITSAPTQSGEKTIDGQVSPPKLSLLEKVLQWAVGIKPGVKNPNNPNLLINAENQPMLKEEMVKIEDQIAQNQMTVIVPIKSNIISKLLLRLVLVLIAQGAKASSSFGNLSGLSTIHFARWAIIDNGKNLLFESNYDGSWENYIDDFVDSANAKMNMIWGNCVGYPVGGCQDIEWFKAYIRQYQIPAQIFHSAYRETTVKNILNDLNICKATEQYLQKKEVQKFMSGDYSAPTYRNPT